MTPVAGKVCAVTGAGSGIGRALALELARRGARAVAISDVDAARVEQTAAALEGIEVHQAALDVADRRAVSAHADAVAERFGVVHQIYNNAGVAGSTSLLEADYDEIERILGVNLWGVIHGTLAFLPHLVASGDGHVVNVSSLNGYVAQAGAAPYCTSKFAVRGFTESLRAEMLRDAHPVQVTVVHPGGVRTDIASAALRRAAAPTAEDIERARLYNEKLLRMDPAQAARIVLDGVEAGRPRVRVGNDARALDLLVRIAPSRYPQVLRALELCYRRTMRNATRRGTWPRGAATSR